MTDHIADLLTRIRNSIMAGKTEFIIPSSKMKEVILDILQREGYITEVKNTTKNNQKFLRVVLAPHRYPTHVRQISKPGQRIYVKSKEIPRPLRGLGLIIVSTSKGVVSGQEAIKKGLGGELICEVW